MEYFIENSLLVSDLDNLENILIYEDVEKDTDKFEGVVIKIIKKIKEIIEKLKKLLSSEKVKKEIEEIKKSKPAIQEYENVLKKKDPEKLEEEEKIIKDKSIFNGVHVKDYIEVFKEFFKYNLNCIKTGKLFNMKPLKNFLNKKQKTVNKIAGGLTMAVSIFINAFLQFKGMTIQNDGMLAVEELEKRASKKIKDSAFKKGVMKSEKEYLRNIQKEHSLSKDQMRLEKYASKARVDEIMDKREHPDGMIDVNLDNTNEKTAALILKAGITEFNNMGALIGSGLNVVLGLCGRSKEIALKSAAIEAEAVSKKKIEKNRRVKKITKVINDTNEEYHNGRAMGGYAAI